MKATTERTGNEITITITATEQDLEPTVRSTYNRLRQSVEAKGFRPGKAPNNIIDRELGEQTVQAEILDAAAEKLYRQALESEDIRPINSPHVEVKKLVPYTELELVITVETMPDVKLGDYKKLRKERPVAKVEDSEVEDVLVSLQDRLAGRKEVERAAKDGDEVVIDFEGKKNGEKVEGAQANDYPLLLGSNRFIPGFEEEIVGLSPGDEKTFTITFPKDYAEKSLAGTEVEFSVTLHKVSEITKPELDDEFAKSAGPFDSLKGLRSDVADHLKSEKEQQLERSFNNEVVDMVVDQAEVDVPQSMLEQERTRIEADFARSLDEQGVSREEYLKQVKQSEDELKQELESQAQRRVKSALVLTEIAREEDLEVTPDELEVRLQVIAGQYQDEKIQEEIQKPAVRREIANQILAEKTVDKLKSYVAPEAKEDKAEGKAAAKKKAPAKKSQKKSDKPESSK